MRAQNFRDWELVVIGDGAPDRTTAIMSAISKADHRIRYEAHAKSERFGEIYRDQDIRESKAEFVLQLGDDDLWAPGHINAMVGLLRDADWGNQAPLRIAPDGTGEWWPINHGTPQVRSSIVRGVPVSAGPNFVAYRREAYLRLPEGWTCAPPTGPSDAFMWAKFFRLPDLRVASTASTTAIKFPSHVPGRSTLDSEQRLAELQPWLARITESGLLRKLCAKASVRSRLRDLYKLHDVTSADSWTQALARCGFIPNSEDGTTHPVHNGAPLALPLSDGQQEEADSALQDHLRQVAAGLSKKS